MFSQLGESSKVSRESIDMFATTIVQNAVAVSLGYCVACNISVCINLVVSLCISIYPHVRTHPCAVSTMCSVAVVRRLVLWSSDSVIDFLSLFAHCWTTK